MTKREDILYRKIMSNISKSLNRMLNESENESDDLKTRIEKATDYFLKDYKTNGGDIDSKKLKDAIAWLTTIYKGCPNIKQSKYKESLFTDVTYIQLLDSLEKRINDGRISVNERTRRNRRY